MSKDVGMVIHKSSMVPFLPCLVAYNWGFRHLFIFRNVFPVTCFCGFLFEGGGGGGTYV